MLHRPLAVAVGLLALFAVANAADFNPEKYGLVEPDAPYYKPHAGLECTFLRNAAEGTKKVFQCSDGSQRFGDKDVWSYPALKAPEPEKPEIANFDPEVTLPGYSYLTLTTWINNRHCWGSKPGKCHGREVQSFNHMFLPADHATCMIMAEKIAYQEYVAANVSRERINVSYECK